MVVGWRSSEKRLLGIGNSDGEFGDGHFSSESRMDADDMDGADFKRFSVGFPERLGNGSYRG